MTTDADVEQKATIHELLNRVMAIPKVPPRSPRQAKMRNLARLISIRQLAQEAIDDAMEVLLLSGDVTHAESFIAIRQWAQVTIDEMFAEAEDGAA